MHGKIKDSIKMFLKQLKIKDYDIDDFTFEHDFTIQLAIPEDGIAYDETFIEVMGDYINNVINPLTR